VSESESRVVCQQVDRGLNTPLTSAVGRLFDAVAALIGVRQRVTYEAQAAIELEMLARQWAPTGVPESRPDTYPYGLETESVIRLRPLLEAIQADLARGVSPAQIAWCFHQTMAGLIVVVCRQIAADAGVETVALSGGCFQNRLLLSWTVQALEGAGFRVLMHRQVPCNDGGISLGQAALASFMAQHKGAPHEVR
jgi:hydrogenase maturation protein HypF